MPDPYFYYSPFPPLDYTYAGAGHGEWVKGSVPKWNMCWLTFPELDLYLQGASLHEMVMKVQPSLFGAVMACMDPSMDQVFPGLRQALESKPGQFWEGFRRGPWENLPAAEFLPDWPDRVESRLESIGFVTSTRLASLRQEAEHAERTAVGNVVYAKFGRAQ